MLQVAIGLTGNYGFFNLLTCALYLTVLDDGYVSRLLPSRLVQIAQIARGSAAVLVEPAAWRAVLVSAALIIGLVSSLTLWREATYTRPHAEWSDRVVGLVQPTRSINGYGLFRTMTTERPEIVIEGDIDLRDAGRRCAWASWVRIELSVWRQNPVFGGFLRASGI